MQYIDSIDRDSSANPNQIIDDTQFCKVGTIRPFIEMAPENKQKLKK